MRPSSICGCFFDVPVAGSIRASEMLHLLTDLGGHHKSMTECAVGIRVALGAVLHVIRQGYRKVCEVEQDEGAGVYHR